MTNKVISFLEHLGTKIENTYDNWTNNNEINYYGQNQGYSTSNYDPYTIGNYN